MRYYKLIDHSNTFIGVITEKDFRKYQSRNNTLLICGYKEAEFARCNENIYRDRSWMKRTITNKVKYEDVNIINITEDEYNILSKSIKSGEEIKPVNDVFIEGIVNEPITISSNKIDVLDYVINAKIKEMSRECNETIINGFYVRLSDNNMHHFSLSLEDQLNLLNISNKLNDGDSFLYHADNEPYKYYSASDMKIIIDNAEEYKKYNTVYFSGLKMYIKSLTDIKQISDIKYGIELPNEYKLNV